MNVIKDLLHISLLCCMSAMSSSVFAVAIQVDFHSSVEITTDSGVSSHNDNSANSVYSYVNNEESYTAVIGGNGNNVINADVFLSPSLKGSRDYTSTTISAKLSQKALITNSLADTQKLSFDYLIAAGHLSNVFRSGLGVQDGYENLNIEFCADIFLNGNAIWSTKTGLLQNKSTHINVDQDNLLTKSGADLNTGIGAGVSNGFYSWDDNAGRLHLGTLGAGQVFELEYTVGLIINGSRRNCDGDSFFCDEERLFNTAAQVRFGDDAFLKGMKMDSSTIVAQYVPEPGAWVLMLISMLMLTTKMYRRYHYHF